MSFGSNLQPSTLMLCAQMLLHKRSIAGCDSFKSLITFSERKAMVLAFGYVLSIEHSAFSTLRFFNTPHFQHSAFSTLRDSRRAFFNVSIYLLSNLAQWGFPKVLKVFNFIVSTFVEFYAIETWRFVNEW